MGEEELELEVVADTCLDVVDFVDRVVVFGLQYVVEEEAAFAAVVAVVMPVSACVAS